MAVPGLLRMRQRLSEPGCLREVAGELHRALLAWFAANARPLPWREQYLPYQVWISEIMLQQTQAERGVAYFTRWVERFPDVESLAQASLEEVMKCWEGLGYYSRARNLQAAALRIIQAHGGKLPETLPALLALPGIGKYTARAILSIAYEQDHPVVDGNVERVFARLFAIDEPVKSQAGQEAIWNLAERLLPAGRARAWNQALMEFGALVCGRGTPHCELCPVTEVCASFAAGETTARPVVTGGRKTVAVTMVAAILVDAKGRAFVRQRPVNTRWAGLWEFPNEELREGGDPARAVASLFHALTGGLAVSDLQPLPAVSHKYTKYLATVYPFLCYLPGAGGRKFSARNTGRWLRRKELDSLAFSSGHRQIIDALPELCPDRSA